MKLLIIFLLFFPLLTGCDPEHRKKCEWYLEPDPQRAGKVDKEYIPVCARNYVTNKQDCRLQTTLEYAKKVSLMKFRYTDLSVEHLGNPRTITQIKFCDEQ
ncbi:MAG: hypothetical protein HQK54_02720 [Oligoflexales bacterium]|nr:hypothetical protein [Oligoflexales bacterium]